MGIEREVKLGVWAGFQLPDLGDLAPEVAVVQRPVQTLMAVYHDTPDLRLARWGITLRHRSGDGSRWTLKLPEGDEGPALVRRELDFEGPANRMPAAAASLVLAYARGVALVPVAKLRAQVRRLPSDPSPEKLHQVRIRAKHARYAAKVAVPLVGKRAKRLAQGLADLQTVLGDHQDAVVTERWLRRSIASAEPAVREAAEELIAVQRAEAEDCRRRWRPAWKKASAERRRSRL